MPEGYGFLRPSGLLPSSNDIYVSASQIRRFGLRNGDVVWASSARRRIRNITKRCSALKT